jgi:energy-converting hydrogenase A subunit M
LECASLEELHIATTDARGWLYDDISHRNVEILQNRWLKRVVCRGKAEEARTRTAMTSIEGPKVAIFRFVEDPMEKLME